ncbi:MAG: hypothetical protein ACKOJF_21185 [Planctomycetaceae bacterium]
MFPETICATIRLLRATSAFAFPRATPPLVLLACLGMATLVPAQDRRPVALESPRVVVRAGELPILLSAPHGGTLPIPGVPPRKGEGLETGPAGFFTGRDGGTEELAYELAAELRRRFGKPPYLVVSRVHRRYLDPNRPPEIAYEDPDAAPAYEAYHGAMTKFCGEMTSRFRCGVVLDLHGQGTAADTVFRGTKNGQTTRRLQDLFGVAAQAGEQSLFGLLASRGVKVHPQPLDGREASGFTGGYIVRTYGDAARWPIDAHQLEMGADYRSASGRRKTARKIADALVRYAELYLEHPSEELGDHHPLPPELPEESDE